MTCKIQAIIKNIKNYYSIEYCISAIILALFASAGGIGSIEKKMQSMVDNFALATLIYILIKCRLLFVIFSIVLALVSYINKKYNICGAKKNATRVDRKRKYFIATLIFIGILLLWMPYYLTFYPGIVTYDSIESMKQIMGSAQYSDHHPWIYTVTVGIIYKIGYMITGNANDAVGIYSFISMLVMSSTFTYLIMYMYEKGAHTIFLALVYIFFAVDPTNAIYAITMWKDIFFAAIVLLFVIRIFNMQDEYDSGKINTKSWILFALLSILLCVARSNGLYAYIIVAPATIWKFRRQLKPALIYIMGVIIAVALYKGPVMKSYDVRQPDILESLHIPLQQMACTIVNGGNISTEDLNELNKIINVYQIPEFYETDSADPIKELIRNKGNLDYFNNHISEYAKIYIRIGLNNPYNYIKGYIMQTNGFWYYNTKGYLFTRYLWKNDYGIERSPRCPVILQNTVNKIIDKYEALPQWWNATAMITWLFVVIMAIARDNKKSLYPFIVIVALLLTILIATPLAVEVRYVYYMWVTWPVFLLYSFQKNILEV